MGGLKVARLFPVAIAGASLGMWGCALRTFDFGFETEAGDGSGGSDTTGTPIDPTSEPTDPTNPTDPTSDPTDPTVDPTDPTSMPPGPPQLIDVAFLDNLTLQLTFTEAVTSVEGVDPEIFRLSVGYSYTGKYGGTTFYQEVGYLNGNPYCNNQNCYDECYYDDGPYYGTSDGYYEGGYEGPKYCYEYCYDYCPPYENNWIRALQVRNDSADPAKILLTLDRGISGQLCANLGEAPEEFTVGLFLHYTDDRPPFPTNEAGIGLYPIGEDWVIFQEPFLEVEGFFPQLNPMLPIPCPF